MPARRRQGRAVPRISSGILRMPPEIRLPHPPLRGRFAVPDPSAPPCPGSPSFTNMTETMMTIDQHIEELRAELRNAVYRGERRKIEAELAAAIAERDAALATWAQDPPQ